jgi:hypothetical protein
MTNVTSTKIELQHWSVFIIINDNVCYSWALSTSPQNSTKGCLLLHLRVLSLSQPNQWIDNNACLASYVTLASSVATASTTPVCTIPITQQSLTVVWESAFVVLYSMATMIFKLVFSHFLFVHFYNPLVIKGILKFVHIQLMPSSNATWLILTNLD